MVKITNKKQNFKKLSFLVGEKTKITANDQGYLVSLKTEEIQDSEILFENLCQLFKQISESVILDSAEIKKLNPEIILRALNFAFYRLEEFKTVKKPSPEIVVNGMSNQDVEFYQIKFDAINHARYLDDLPPNIATPAFIADYIQTQAQDIENLTVKIFTKKEIQKLGLGLLLAVNQGSVNEPRLVVLEYQPQKNQPITAALIGKGITMDTGGYSLKINGAQLGMKLDMCGAALVLNSLIALAKLKTKKNLVAIGALTDNCIGYGSTFVESIHRSYSGRSVEINNTDAEGRLVLADAISYSQKVYQPEEIVDYATLTGGVKNALGIKLTGVFTNYEPLFEKFDQVSQKTGEPLWLLPIQRQNYENMHSLLADIKNASTNRDYGVGNAAAFLETFANPTKWIHFDIAGTAVNQGQATGVLIETTIEVYK